MYARRLVQIVLNESGLNAGGAGFGVEMNQAMHVPRQVEHDGLPDGLAREARSRTSRKYRDVELPSHLDRRHDIVHIPWVGDA